MGEHLSVLQVISSTAISGAERHVWQLSQTLADRGHRIHVVLPGAGWLPDRLRSSHIGFSESRMKGRGWLRSAVLIAREARRRRADALHCHLTRATYIGYTAGLLTRVPVVSTVHVTNNDFIYRRVASGRNRLVAVSDFVRGMLHGRGISDRYISTVHNGTDFLDVAPAAVGAFQRHVGIPEGKTIVGVVGRVCREKGHLEMLEAMPEIRRLHPEAHLVFVGRIEQAFEGEVHRASEALGLDGSLTLTGPRDDVPHVLDAFAVTAMPSHRETFGLAALESMARGTPVVASRVGGLPEIVRHRQTGLLVDLDPAEIAEAVGYLLAHPNERLEMGRRGQSMVEEAYTIREMAARFEKLYTAL